MIFEQTIEIPADRRVRLDFALPQAIPCGSFRLKFVPQAPSTMLMSEASLAKDWNSPEEDLAWENL
jgi:hypothetical protein